MHVLRGAQKLLSRDKPKLLVEVKKDNEEAVFAFLDKQNYLRFRLEDLIGIEGTKENYFFFPDKGA